MTHSQEEGDHAPASLPLLPQLDRALDCYCKVGAATGSCDQQNLSRGTVSADTG